MLVVSGATCAASWSSYGSGLAGTLGVPALVASAAPVIGTTIDVQLGNAAGVGALALLHIGLVPAGLPAKGGTLWLVPLLSVGFVLPAGGVALPLAIPADTALCGFPLYFQLTHLDAGAPVGVAFTPGLRLDFGG